MRRTIRPTPALHLVRGRGSSTAAIACAALLLAGCESYYVEDYSAPTARKYPTAENASEKCLEAAARARKWCRDQTVSTDTTWAGECRAAQWDYGNACR